MLLIVFDIVLCYSPWLNGNIAGTRRTHTFKPRNKKRYNAMKRNRKREKRGYYHSSHSIL